MSGHSQQVPAAAAESGERAADSGDAAPRATFRQLLPYLLEHPRRLAGIVAISLLASLLTLAQPLLVSVLIGQVEQGTIGSWLVWLLVAVVTAGAALQGVQHYLLQRTGESIVRSTRRRLVAKLLRLPITEFDARRTGDLVSRVGSDTVQLRAVLTQGLVEAVGGLLTLLGAIIGMLVLDAVLFAVTAGVVLVAVALVAALSGRIRSASAAAQAQLGALTAGVERSISAARMIRATGAAAREEQRIGLQVEATYRRGLDVASASAFVVPAGGFAVQAALIAVLGVGGLRVAAGELSIASLIGFVMFLFLLVMPLGLILGGVLAVNQALGALGRIQEILELPDEQARDHEFQPRVRLLGPANEDAAPDAAALAFEAVSFRYAPQPAPADPGRAETAERRGLFGLLPSGQRTERGGAGGRARRLPPGAPLEPSREGAEAQLDDARGLGAEPPLVLDSVSFRVPRGARVALVGPSGAGKSTSFALIERFYDPVGGRILLGGVDLRSIDRDELRSQIGYVQQDAHVLAGTLRENLQLGRGDADDEACVAALREVNLAALVDRNPQGLDAQVGEGGILLSGGERQRLAIARTLLAAAPILLLDESTSALDGANERAMKGAIDRVAEGRSLVVIAHRLSTVVDSDLIVVLDRGRVIGSGTHAELVDSLPLYRDLAAHQLLV